MSWDEVCNNFASINVNWDPANYEHALSRNGVWSSPDQLQTSIGFPIFSLTVQSPIIGAPVWLLLNRHRRSGIDDDKHDQSSISVFVSEEGLTGKQRLAHLAENRQKQKGEELNSDWYSVSSAHVRHEFTRTKGSLMRFQP